MFCERRVRPTLEFVGDFEHNVFWKIIFKLCCSDIKAERMQTTQGRINFYSS